MNDKEKQFENFVRDISFDDTPDANHRGKLERQLFSAMAKKPSQQIKTWRIIMKSNIAKLATAAAVIIIAVLGITALDKSVTPAYAIEQTIEALQKVSTVHVICTDWDDRKFEVWLKLNPETGKETHLYAIVPSLGTTIISKPNRSYVYSEETGFVQVYDNKIAKSDISFTRIFEDMAEQMAQLEDGESVEIYRFTELQGDEDFIVISIDTKKQETEIFIDPETKLPVRITRTKAENMGDMLKSADEFNYNVTIPSELVDFEIPDGAKVVDASEQIGLLDDPNFGISAEGLSEKEAFVKLAMEYWQAVIDEDLDRVRKLCPSLGGLSDKTIKAKHGGENPPVALLEVGQPYDQRGLGLGKVTPCIIKFSDGKILEIGMITVFRNINDYSYSVIYGTWAQAREIE